MLGGMFERFTGKARHVVVLSQEEARRLNHNYIGTEHILLGLLGERASVGGEVLAGFGLTLDGARAEVEAIIGRGKGKLSGHIPFTPRAKKVLELSLREALSLKHNYIGTEHVLLGLIREQDGVAAQIISGHADLLAVRAAVLDAVRDAMPLGGEPAPEETDEAKAVLRWLRQRLTRHGSHPPFPPGAVAASGTAGRGTPAVEAALQHAAQLAGSMPVGSHHLLLAALDDSDSAASSTLASLGIDLDELRERLRSATVAGTSDERPEQAGGRQMAIQVSSETLTLVATDPVIVAAGQEALRAVNDQQGSHSATVTVIRGDHPQAAGLADVWLELHKTLSVLAAPPRTAPEAAQQAGEEPGMPSDHDIEEDPRNPPSGTD
jgi:ATP-dependent Clp protease ATP-binding subunit ClpA